MLFSERSSKGLRLTNYLRGRHFILCLFLCNGIFSEIAWADSAPQNSAPSTLQTSPADLPASALPVSTSELRSATDDFPAVDLYDLEVQEDSLINNPTINHGQQESDILYLAAPENLNPGRYIPPSVELLPESLPPDPIESEPVTPDSERAESDEGPFVPIWDVDGLTVNLSDDFSNFDQGNRIIEPTVTGTLPNGDRLAVTDRKSVV